MLVKYTLIPDILEMTLRFEQQHHSILITISLQTLHCRNLQQEYLFYNKHMITFYM